MQLKIYIIQFFRAKKVTEKEFFILNFEIIKPVQEVYKK